MRLLIPLLFFYLSSCCGCDEPHIENNNLSDAEVDSVIMQGYADYIDSIDRERIICNQFSMMLDTAYTTHLIYEQEGKKVFVKYKWLDGAIIWGGWLYSFERKKMPFYDIDSVRYVTLDYVDSTCKMTDSLFDSGDHSIWPPPIYCISKPFRPFNSELVVIQEHCMTNYGCIIMDPDQLIFKKINGRWKLQSKVTS